MAGQPDVHGQEWLLLWELLISSKLPFTKRKMDLPINCGSCRTSSTKLLGSARVLTLAALATLVHARDVQARLVSAQRRKTFMATLAL